MVENQAVENPNVTTTNKTVNYGLPLWEKDDVTSYMNDMNAAMNIIDNTMHSNALVQGTVLETADDAKSTAEEAMTVANSFNDRINNLVQQQTETSSTVEHLQSDVQDNTTAIGNLDSNSKSLDARVGANEEAIGTLGNRVDSVEASVADAVQKATTAETSAQNAETAATTAETTANEAKQEVEMLQTAVDTNTDDINRLGEQIYMKFDSLNLLSSNGTVGIISLEIFATNDMVAIKPRMATYKTVSNETVENITLPDNISNYINQILGISDVYNICVGEVINNAEWFNYQLIGTNSITVRMTTSMKIAGDITVSSANILFLKKEDTN